MSKAQQLMVQRAEEILTTLHSIGYFNDDEFIKVDGILHKGSYVLTDGPPQQVNLLDDSPFFTFTNDETTKDGVHTNEIELSSEDEKIETSVVAASTVDTPETLTEIETSASSPVETEPESEMKNSEEGTKTTWESTEVKHIWDEDKPSDAAPEILPESNHKEGRSRSPSRAHVEEVDHNQQWQNVRHKPSAAVSTHSSIHSKESRPYASPLTRQGTGTMPTPDTLVPDMIVVARYASKNANHIVLGIEAGDRIKVLKFVSGIMYLGENFRTGLTGQFNKLFVDVVEEGVEEQTIGHSSAYHCLDNIEAVSAAEWNGHYSSSSHTPAASIGPSSRLPLKLGGLSSRSSSASGPSSTIGSITTVDQETVTLSRSDLDTMVEEKFAQLIKAQGRTAKPSGLMPSAYSAATDKSAPYTIPHLQSSYKTPPATVTSRKVSTRNTAARTSSLYLTVPGDVRSGRQLCHYFITPYRECRFQAEECKDLHMMPEAAERLFRLYDPSMESATAKTGSSKDLSCYYWATDGEDCTYSSAECKFLHRWTGKIAKVPHAVWRKQSRRGPSEQTSNLADEVNAASASEAEAKDAASKEPEEAPAWW